MLGVLVAVRFGVVDGFGVLSEEGRLVAVSWVGSFVLLAVDVTGMMTLVGMVTVHALTCALNTREISAIMLIKMGCDMGNRDFTGTVFLHSN